MSVTNVKKVFTSISLLTPRSGKLKRLAVLAVNRNMGSFLYFVTRSSVLSVEARLQVLTTVNVLIACSSQQAQAARVKVPLHVSHSTIWRKTSVRLAAELTCPTAWNALPPRLVQSAMGHSSS